MQEGDGKLLLKGESLDEMVIILSIVCFSEFHCLQSANPLISYENCVH